MSHIWLSMEKSEESEAWAKSAAFRLRFCDSDSICPVRGKPATTCDHTHDTARRFKICGNVS